MGASHIQKTVHEGHSVQYGPFHGSESEEKVTKRDLSTKTGATKPIDDKVYKDKVSGGFGPIKVEETDEGTTVKADVSKAEVNALIVGVELGTSVVLLIFNVIGFIFVKKRVIETAREELTNIENIITNTHSSQNQEDSLTSQITN